MMGGVCQAPNCSMNQYTDRRDTSVTDDISYIIDSGGDLCAKYPHYWSRTLIQPPISTNLKQYNAAQPDTSCTTTVDMPASQPCSST